MKTPAALYTNHNATCGILFMSMELSFKRWKLGFGNGSRERQVTIDARNFQQLKAAVSKAKEALNLPEEAPVYSCYEAGRDGFWIHRCLRHLGIINLVVDSSSIEVSRRQRRAKTDCIDAHKLLSMLLRYYGGEKRLWGIARVPSVEQEDERRVHRELERLKKEQGAHSARIKSLLILHGLVAEKVGGKDWPARVRAFQQWDGSALSLDLRNELIREGQRLEVVRAQIRELDDERKARLKRCESPRMEQIARLMRLKAIGLNSAWMFVMEFYGWREFKNRRQIGALAGLTGTPHDSGDSLREQGISKAGNRRIRAMIMEIAWLWLRYQPNSKLSRWYGERFAGSSKRMRRVGIVALARRLLIDLWRYLKAGVVPEGAVLQG